MRTGSVLALIVLCAGVVLPAADPVKPLASVPRDGADWFEKQVRPLLAEHCWSCHGEKKQRSGLRLDSRAGLLKGGENGPVVKPGDPDASRLLQAVRRDGDLKMPPKGRLNLEQVEALAAWIKMGAPWPDTHGLQPVGVGNPATHWAFQPLRDPPLPRVNNASWVKTPVDSFILAKLEEKGLSPSRPADRRTLIRRAAFDLIGLPPTPEEVAAFEADTSPDAFAKVVDRLLASPHYGERWGRHWLDVARYADTKGYVFFEDANLPWAYTYRDYVIHAFNEDLPYDRFILEQLAADLLLKDEGGRMKDEARQTDVNHPSSFILHPLNRRSLRALGFLTLGSRFMSNQHDILDDRIDVVTRGLMGLTVSCARCHDHKYDPIPSKDYYSLYGVFAGSVEPIVPPLFADPPATEAYRKFQAELEERERKLSAFVRQKHFELIAGARQRAGDYLLAAHALQGQPRTDDFMLLADGNDLNPKMILRWQVFLEETRKPRHPVFAPWHAFAELERSSAGASPSPFAEKARQLAAKLPSQPIHPLVAKAFAERPPESMADVARRYGELLAEAERQWQKLLVDAWVRTAGLVLPSFMPQKLSDPAWEELRQVLYGPDTPPDLAMIPFGDLDLLPDRPAQAELQKLRKAVEEWRVSGPGAPARAMALEELATSYQPRVFRRGNPNNLGEPVPRQFLAVLAREKRKPFEHGSGRLELARAIVERNNPLTARVIVNRVWLHHFGQGLVRTPSDFGLRSEPPTHPELLDHLAAWFMDNGWSLKKLHRHIMLSATYQQVSTPKRAAGFIPAERIDPENTLLWRMNRRRLDFESTRDALLAVSGRLNRTIGGPSVKDSLAANGNRRSLYSHLDRLNVPGLLRTFDFPNPDATSPQRDQTTVPPQALFLMNHPFVIDSARALLKRPEIAKERTMTRRVVELHRLLYGREPKLEELALAEEYLQDAGQNDAAWERYIQALLMANEFVFVD